MMKQAGFLEVVDFFRESGRAMRGGADAKGAAALAERVIAERKAAGTLGRGFLAEIEAARDAEF